MLMFFVLVLVVVLFWNANSNSNSKILDGVESYSIFPTIKILPLLNKYQNAQKLTTTTATRIPLIPVTTQLLSASSSSSLSAAQKDQEEEQSQEQEEQTGVIFDDENGEDGIDLVATNNAILSSEEIQKQENFMNSIRNGYSGMPSSGYSRSLYGTDTRSTPDDIDEDGYGEHTRGNGDRKSPSILKRTVKFPINLVQALVRRIQLKEKKQEKPGTLILVRHGESTWNANKTFTGWADPDLTLQGKREMEHAARLIMEAGYHYDIHLVFTSRLKRAIRSTWILLQEFNEVYLPVFKSWRLNERSYGALTGLNKTQTAERLGEDLVQGWRGSLRKRPPPISQTNNMEYYPGNDRKYADLTPEQVPLTESLLDCMTRTQPVWENKIVYELKKGRNVLVVAHANTLRGLVKTIDNIGEEEIQDVAIPTGIPIIYKFNRTSDGHLISIDDDSNNGNSGLISQLHMKGKFLEKPGLLKEALKLEANWKTRVPGYDPIMQRQIRPMTGLERSLYKLNAVRELGDWADEFIDLETEEDDGNDGNGSFYYTSNSSSNGGNKTILNNDDLLQEEEESSIDIDGSTSTDSNIVVPPTMVAQPCVVGDDSSFPSPVIRNRQDSVIVIIRHGKTQHNKLGLFTGWFDAPLAEEGIEEAKEAGRNLKKFGFEFDVVYTSWLSRAVETAWFVMDEMDCLWLPIVKTWRLNERMYGKLTGMSKQMVKQRHGEEQFKAWRRGYDVRPPAVSSFSNDYPGNDERYQKYCRDLRYSIKESAIRSIEKGRLVKARKIPKTESLKDCMDRTLPYFIERIAKDAVDKNKRVLISSSENAIRGLLMHLCEIPESEITGLEIPNGLPIIYDVRSKCVKLLDDGTGRDPLKVYNFGSAANYLFRPCQNEDGSLDEECSINFDSTFSGEPIPSEDQKFLDNIKATTTTTQTA